MQEIHELSANLRRYFTDEIRDGFMYL